MLIRFVVPDQCDNYSKRFVSQETKPEEGSMFQNPFVLRVPTFVGVNVNIGLNFKNQSGITEAK